MTLKHILFALLASTHWVMAATFCQVAQGEAPPAPARGKPKVVRDLMWVWGNPEMAEEGPHTLATFAQASPAQRARLLGAANIIMAGYGIPDDDQQADLLTKQVATFPRLLWEIRADGKGGPPFVYEKRMAQVRNLVDRYPQIEGIVLDDMSTIGIDKGLKPEHIRHIRALLPGTYRRVKIWGVVYTMTLDRQRINDYIEELDVILLAEWHAKNIVHLEKNVAHLERLFPDKPIVLGTYLYDYGHGRRMPLDLLEKQYEIALRLLHAGRIVGIEFTTITNDPQALRWTADWIRRVGHRKVSTPPAQARR